MSLNISIEDDYILMESSEGMVYWKIMEGISKLIAMPEFKDKNDIWLFRNGQLKIMYSYLYSIKDSVSLYNTCFIIPYKRSLNLKMTTYFTFS